MRLPSESMMGSTRKAGTQISGKMGETSLMMMCVASAA